MNNDETLWRGIMKGDEKMFLELYRKYYHTLLYIGLKEIKNPDLVKDAIQQQFLYLWEKRQTIQEAKNVKSYLITSFLRLLIVDNKKTVKAGNLHISWSNFSVEPQPTPEEKLIKKDDQNHLARLLINHINELPARQKELIKLKFYEGLSYEEIVQKTGLSYRTVYNTIYEALKNLKLDMGKSQYPHSASIVNTLLLMLTTAATSFAGTF